MTTPPANTSIDDLCEFIRRKYRLSPAKLARVYGAIQGYYARQKDFDLIVDKGRVIVLAKKTPTPSPMPSH